MSTTPPEHHLVHPKYRPDIDGLRAIAVLSVVVYHAFPKFLRGGFVGVDIFFVISGFLISTIIFNSLNKQVFNFAEFYARRIRRIFPALILVLSATYAVGWFALFADEFQQLGKHMAGSAGFVANFIFWGESGYFDNASETKPLLHLWSLGIEEQYYIVWPLLMWGAWRFGHRVLLIASLFFAGSFIVNVVGVRSDPVATFFLPYSRFWELLAGSLLAYFTSGRPQPIFSGLGSLQPLLAWCRKRAGLFSWLGLFLIVGGFLVINKQRSFPGWWAILPVVGAVLIIGVGSRSVLNRRILSSRLMVWFGLISYPLYLWHWPVFSFARIIEGETPTIQTMLLLILVSVVLAGLTYGGERAIRRDQGGFRKNLILVCSMLVIGAGGYLTYRYNGLEYRSVAASYRNNKGELVRTVPMDAACKAYLGTDSPRMPYCRFNDAGSNKTLAVIGDSHAHVAYPGIAKAMQMAGNNTVLLANSGCPPFIGAEYGDNEKQREDCRLRIDSIIEAVLARSDIDRVVLFSRGAIYLSGKGYGDAEKDQQGPPLIVPERFRRGLQRTIDRLNVGGKKVFYVLENPETGLDPSACMPRPFRHQVNACEIDLAAVLARQSEYRALIASLTAVTVIDPTKAFCPEGICRLLTDGNLLYADDDHLSVFGSSFQMENVLKPYLFE